MMQTKMVKLIRKNLNNLSNKISILSDCLCLLRISMLGSNPLFLKNICNRCQGIDGGGGGGGVLGKFGVGWVWLGDLGYIWDLLNRLFFHKIFYIGSKYGYLYATSINKIINNTKISNLHQPNL